MKGLLITVNVILTLVVVWAGFQRLETFSGKKKQEYTVKKRPDRKPVPKPAAGKKSEPRSPKQDAEVVISKNIFSQDRSPNSTMGGNARVELSLVGTFSIGSCTGAIIKQKTSNRNNNFFPMGGPQMGGPQMGGRRQMGIAQRGGRPGPAAMNRQQGGNVAAGSNQLVYKQYVRVGETLSNGYKLVDVQREKVTLQRGSDKLELTIEEASKNAPATARQQNRGNRQINNTTRILQTMQNMQRMQMFQNFQMMRMMNNNRPDMNNNNNNNNNNRNSGYSGGRRAGNRAR